MTDTWRDRLFLLTPFLAIGLLAVVTPSDDGLTICPFALCTGSACPGCGMTRAASSLIRGDIGAAMVFHPLVILISFQAISWWVWYVLRRKDLVGPMSQRTLTVILASTGVALVAVWIVRLVSGSLPAV